jgi:hypothetical protein
LAVTVIGRSAPPMIEPSWSKGLALPKSMTKPVFPELVEKVMEVPVLMQNDLFALALGIFGFAVAEVLPLRLMSIVQGDAAEPQVLASAQTLAGLDAEQTSFFTLVLVSWLALKLVRRSTETNRKQATAR